MIIEFDMSSFPLPEVVLYHILIIIVRSSNVLLDFISSLLLILIQYATNLQKSFFKQENLRDFPYVSHCYKFIVL